MDNIPNKRINPRMVSKTVAGENSQNSVITRGKSKTKKPSMYNVVLMNDDYTPMDFVVYVLKSYFHKPHEEAVGIMLQIHHNGSAVCGYYTRDVAETKVEHILSLSRQNEHPLKCVMEKE